MSKKFDVDLWTNMVGPLAATLISSALPTLLDSLLGQRGRGRSKGRRGKRLTAGQKRMLVAMRLAALKDGGRKRKRRGRQRGRGLLLGANSPLAGIPLLGDIF